jgi:bacteriorhodopsin
MAEVHQIEESIDHAAHVIVAKGSEVYLRQDDLVGVSFWVISMAMVATTVFLLSETHRVKAAWKTSVNCSALVTLIAAVHYFYMRGYWVSGYGLDSLGSPKSPLLYRYIDWSLTVPLQMIEFYLILKAIAPKDVSGGMFFRLLVGTVVMLAAGFCGEAELANPMMGFVIGICGWMFILYEIFAGEGNQIKSQAGLASPAVQSSFETMRFIVSVGWSIYPLGYFFGFLNTAVDPNSLNLIYNIADFVNKIAFCLIIWNCAVQDTEATKDSFFGLSSAKLLEVVSVCFWSLTHHKRPLLRFYRNISKTMQ